MVTRNFGYLLCYKCVHKDTDLRRTYETNKILKKVKTKLNKLWWETDARKVHKKPSIVKQLFIDCIIFKTDVASLQYN